MASGDEIANKPIYMVMIFDQLRKFDVATQSDIEFVGADRRSEIYQIGPRTHYLAVFSSWSDNMYILNFKCLHLVFTLENALLDTVQICNACMVDQQKR